ncbi:MAG: NUDIX hydrolase [Gammaproteobacteria bacterium]|nr:NUDIX hydrolase [Gammaproteobacteria bacterium]
MNTQIAKTDKPRLTAAAVIVQDGKYLMVYEDMPMQGVVLNQPSGHIENDESLIDAVKREVLEETGHTFEPTGWLGLYPYKSPHTGNTQIRLCFVGHSLGFNPDQPLDEPIVKTAWLTRSEIEALSAEHRSPLVMKCVADAETLTALPLDRLSSSL